MTDSFPEPAIQWRAGIHLPAGPPFWSRLLSGQAFRQNAAETLSGNAQRYGDLVYFRIPGRELLQVNHPELVQELLVRDAPHHHRNIVMQRSKAVLGDGLLTSEEPLHMRQRRLAQPAFHRHRIAAYAGVIANYTRLLTGSWRDGETRDVHEDMLLLALRIVGKTLFDLDVQQGVREIAEAVDSFMGFLPLAFLPTFVQRLPFGPMPRIERGLAKLDALIFGMIAERRADPGDRGDLLSMLLAAVDEEGDGSAGERSIRDRQMSDRQVRDECLTALLAGHETTANALSFAMWLLAKHPEIQERLAEECRQALGGRLPVAEDYGRLRYAEQVFAEAMRLYPPVWVTARTAAEDYPYRGFTVRKGTVLLAPQFVVHRDERFYPDPRRFDPSRFSDAARANRPKLSYFPFGAGSRQCIGEGLAWMEGVFILAVICGEWKLSLTAEDTGEIAVDPAVSMRPKGAVRLRLERRPLPGTETRA